MVSYRLAGLLMATVVSAVPFPTDRDLNSTVWTPDHKLQHDEVILYGGDRMEVVHESVWHALLEEKGIALETPEIDHEWLANGNHLAEIPFNETSDSNLHTRDCSSTFSFVTDKTERFVDWDVQMAGVVIGFGAKGVDLTVANSYSVANTVSVSGGLDLKAVKDRLGVNFGVNYSRTWTTQATVTVHITVDDGWTGTIITRPWKNRRYGRTFQGCPGSLRQTGTWMADSYEEGSYDIYSWVSGAITACAKRQRSIPLSRCNGGGNFR